MSFGFFAAVGVYFIIHTPTSAPVYKQDQVNFMAVYRYIVDVFELKIYLACAHSKSFATHCAQVKQLVDKKLLTRVASALEF
jgi:hypothetical protein